MHHVIILGLIGTVSAGLAAIALLPRTSGPLGPAVAWLRVPLLLYNLWTVAYLAAGYVSLYIVGPSSKTAFLLAADFVIVAFGVCWLYAHVVLVERLRAGRRDGRARLVLRAAPLAVGGLFVLCWGVFVASGHTPLVLPLVQATNLSLPLVGLAANTWLLAGTRAPQAGECDLAVRPLAAGYVAVFGSYAIVGLLSGRLRVSAPLALVTGDLLIGLVYMALPVLWSRRLKAIPSATGRAEADALAVRYGITPREREVVELICLGRTNQEIADRLFISVRTVKDHNSAIFQKTGVRNRTELARLFNLPAC